MRVLTRALMAVVAMGLPQSWAGSTSNPYDWGNGANAIPAIGQPRYNEGVPSGSLFVHPLPSTPNPNKVTFMDYAWDAYTPTSITTCSKYISDPMNGKSANCCIGTHMSSGNLVKDSDYGHCSSSTQHNCPGIYKATCNAASNADSANGGGSCPAYVTSGGTTVWPKCRPAESHCHGNTGHCWGTIGCYSSSANTAGTEVPCPAGGFFDQNSEGKPHIYHEGDFCFQDGASHIAKWCGSNTCSPGYGLDSTNTSCVACASPARVDSVGNCCPAIYDIINGICCYLASHQPGVCRVPSGTRGDPQISGFQGQSFQFHGLADEIFNLISTPSLQLNGHFAYLSSGKCTFNDTQCWTHPGTYIDQMGFAFGESRLKLFAGSHDTGMHVEMDGDILPQGNYKLTSNETVVIIKYNHHGTIFIKTPQFHFKIMNSDMFFNMEASLLDQHLLKIGSPKHAISDTQLCKKEHVDHLALEKPTDETIHNHGAVEAAIEKKYGGLQVPLHGLVGQTWRNVLVCGKHWVGGVTDYVTSDLFASDYFFNFFELDQ